MDLAHQLVEFIVRTIDFFLHLDRHLSEIVNQMGGWTYVILFLVIFAETGLVVTPILPGDSLLFAVGAIAALPASGLDIVTVTSLMFVAAILGDATNYAIGKYLGPKVFKKEEGLFLNRNHLVKTQLFYEKYGGKTIILARFIPIIRTFAPFVAGIGNMGYLRFAAFNVIGAFFWVLPFTIAGYYFGSLPFVKQSFHYVVLAIIVLSVLPAAFEIWKVRRLSRDSSKAKKVKINPA